MSYSTPSGLVIHHRFLPFHHLPHFLNLKFLLTHFCHHSFIPYPPLFFPTIHPLEMFSPTEYTGALMDLGQTRRGIYIEQKYLTPERSTLIYEVPLAEVITDFFDQVIT